MSAVDLTAVRRTTAALLGGTRLPVIMHDRGAERPIAVPLAEATAADGLLPVFLVAAEAVWREATGNGFKLRLERDASALLGYRIESIGAGTFPTVMLSVIEAIDQASSPSAVMINDLGAVWKDATDRLDAGQKPAPAPETKGATP